MRIILCGYHWTGCKALELLLDEGHEVYVYTHATENSIADLEGLCIRKHINYSLERIQADNLPFVPDMICSIYYRWIIRQDVIDTVGGKIFNLHPSLLPKYRGCSSLTWAMINGETECGFTYHYIDAGCDTGKIIIQKPVKIEDFDTQLTLYNRVMFESMNYFLDAVHLVQEGYAGEEQKGTGTKYKRGCPLDGRLTDAMDEDMQERFVRAMCYPPYPPAQYNNEEIKTYCDLRDKVLGGVNKVVIFGCGGHARSVVNTLREIDRDMKIVLVDKNAQKNEIILGCRVERQYELKEEDGYIIAIGDNNKRKEIYLGLVSKNAGCCVSVVSLHARVGMETQIGKGTFVASNVYIGPQVKIGDNSILNTGSVIEHEAKVGNSTHIAPGTVVCGRSIIGDNVFCGAGSVIADKIQICDNVVIGAGAVVVKDIQIPGTYVGVPARKIK